jgi:hypothetical protein
VGPSGEAFGVNASASSPGDRGAARAWFWGAADRASAGSCAVDDLQRAAAERCTLRRAGTGSPLGCESLTCIFCGSDAKLTREHVFAQWLRDYFPTDGQNEYLRRQIDFDSDEVHARPGPDFDIVVRDYCSTCNNGWMSDLERAVEPILGPMLKGDARLLTAPEQHTLATWATKTMLTLQGFNIDGTRFVSPERYLWFGKHQIPLSGSYVWLAHYTGSGITENRTENRILIHEWGTTVQVPGKPPPQPSDPINGFQVVFTIGPVVFWLVGYDLPEPVDVTVGSDGAHLLIWPALGPNVAWPPLEPLTTEGELAALSRHIPFGSQLLSAPNVPPFTASELSAAAAASTARQAPT